MSKELTKEDCKRMLSRIGLKLGVSPTLISTILLSEEDKQDMLNGLISEDRLELFVSVWKSTGMQNMINLK